MGLINQSMWWWGWGLDPGVSLTWFGDLAESRRLRYAAQWTWWSCCLSRCSGGLWWADPKTVCTTCPQCREKNIKNRNKKTCRLKYRGGKSMQCKGCLLAALLQVKKKQNPLFSLPLPQVLSLSMMLRGRNTPQVSLGHLSCLCPSLLSSPSPLTAAAQWETLSSRSVHYRWVVLSLLSYV